MFDALSPVFKAIILGIVEGLTEFIPVSSTGHLIIVGHLLGFDGEKGATFEIFIQLGAILAVVVCYWGRFKGLFDLSSKQAFSGLDGILKLGLACIPAIVVGALAHRAIKEQLFSPLTVACALIIGGVVMLLVEKREQLQRYETLESLSLRAALLIGVAQCLALWPGVSRSGATIVGGMLLGCSRKVAAEFSFLLAVPIMCVAVGYDMLKSSSILTLSDGPTFAVGFLVSFVTALFAIRWFLRIVARFGLTPFAYYRIALGIVVLL